jgi:hypothetical protein
MSKIIISKEYNSLREFIYENAEEISTVVKTRNEDEVNKLISEHYSIDPSDYSIKTFIKLNNGEYLWVNDVYNEKDKISKELGYKFNQ